MSVAVSEIILETLAHRYAWSRLRLYETRKYYSHICGIAVVDFIAFRALGAEQSATEQN